MICLAMISKFTESLSPATPLGVARHEVYRVSPRVVLRAGDRIRLSRGPYWEEKVSDGSVVRHGMAERGTAVFVEYCETHESRWIVVRMGRRYASLHVGPEQRSPMIPGFVRRPYVIRKVRRKKADRNNN